MNYQKLLLLIFLPLVLAGCTSIGQTGRQAGQESSNYARKLISSVNQAKKIARDSYIVDKSNQGLTSFPIEVLEQTSIKVLDLSGNKLTSLPAEIGHLVNLEELYLDDNQLTGALPAEIGKMTKLKILSAGHNRLTGIPAEIGRLSNLQEVDFSNNQIDTYPNELVNIKDNLKIFNLSGTAFTFEVVSDLRNKLPFTKVIY